MGLLLCFSVFYWSYSVVTLVYALGNARRRWITVSGDHTPSSVTESVLAPECVYSTTEQAEAGVSGQRSR